MTRSARTRTPASGVIWPLKCQRTYDEVLTTVIADCTNWLDSASPVAAATPELVPADTTS